MSNEQQQEGGLPDGDRELVARALTGELELDAAELAELLRRRPELASELDELLGLREELDDIATAAPLAEPHRRPRDPAFEAFVRGAVGREVAPRARRPRRLAPLALLAAAALVVIAVWLGRDDRVGGGYDDEATLGAGQGVPAGATAWSELLRRGFSWGAIDVPPGAELWFSAVGEAGEPLVDPIDVTGRTSLTVPRSLIDARPAEFTWSLVLSRGVRERVGTWNVSVR